ncbi:MAG TPA: hypothetical protein VK064_09355, partial [Wenzhouxiangella sp.]|nr:hypothetical protein [Wenzhouxiangella sp.]
AKMNVENAGNEAGQNQSRNHPFDHGIYRVCAAADRQVANKAARASILVGFADGGLPLSYVPASAKMYSTFPNAHGVLQKRREFGHDCSKTEVYPGLGMHWLRAY